ncbi:MAG: alpha/beta fold hydrolase, partial [Vicinamibacteria bacterium]
MKSTVVNILLALLLVAAGARGAAAQTTGSVAWEPHTFDVRGVGTVAAEVGRIRVPERRGAPAGRTIEIGFVRLAAKQARRPPVVYLDGGPGGDGHSIARVPAFYRLFDRLRSERDVILLSQRGVGLSR